MQLKLELANRLESCNLFIDGLDFERPPKIRKFVEPRSKTVGVLVWRCRIQQAGFSQDAIKGL